MKFKDPTLAGDIVEFIDTLDNLPADQKPDLRDITWLGQAHELLYRVQVELLRGKQ